MWNGLLHHSNLSALEQTVQFTERRHALLAGNVANMDTPGYQTRDLSVQDFLAALAESLEAERRVRDAGFEASPGVTHTGAASAERAHEKVRDTMKQILYHDGSDVSLEEQVTEIAKNQSMHNTAVALMRSQFHLLQMAIAESVNV